MIDAAQKLPPNPRVIPKLPIAKIYGIQLYAPPGLLNTLHDNHEATEFSTLIRNLQNFCSAHGWTLEDMGLRDSRDRQNSV